MITSLWGIEGSGKSTVGLTFPKPLFHLDLDLGGFDRAIWKLEEDAVKAGKPLKIRRCNVKEDLSKLDWNEWDIVTKPYIVPIQEEKLMGIQQQKGVSVRFPRQVVGVKEIWQEVIIDIVTVCRVPTVKTIMADSATRLWWICHTGLLQEKQEIQIASGIKPEHKDFREQLLPVEFPNDRMRDLIYAVRSFGKNFVMTHYPKDIYASRLVNERIQSYATGEIEPDGFKHTVTLDDIVLWCYAEINKKRYIVEDKNNPKNNVENPDYDKPCPYAKVSIKCGLSGMGMKAVGLELPAPSYEGLMELQTMMKGE